jgi:hypothetical protein
MDFSASQVDEAEPKVGDQFEGRVGVDRGSFDRRVVHEHDIAATVTTQAIEHWSEYGRTEWVVEVDDQVATRETERGGIGAHEADVAADELTAVGGSIILRDRDQCRRDLDADDLAVGTARSVQHDAPEAGAHVDERGTLGCERHRVEQPIDVGDRCRFVVRREFEVRPDGLGIEFAEKNERLGRDAVRGVETLTRPTAQ